MKKKEKDFILKSLRKMKLEDGDYIILKTNDNVSVEQFNNIQHQFKTKAKIKNTIILLEGGMDISILSVKK